jgi:hypothetical protein
VINTWLSVPCTSASLLLEGNCIPQQSAFIRTDILRELGGVNTDLEYLMDYELWIRLGCFGSLVYVPGVVANFRHHIKSKSVSAGYKFGLEQIQWLENWSGLAHILSKDQIAEVKRRTQLKISLEYILADREEEAVYHFSFAFKDGGYPYISIDALAEYILHFRGLNHQPVRAYWTTLLDVVERLPYKKLKLQLKRRLISFYHMKQVFKSNHSDHQNRTRLLLQGIRHDPRWLLNRGVLSMIFKGLFHSTQ